MWCLLFTRFSNGQRDSQGGVPESMPSLSLSCCIVTGLSRHDVQAFPVGGSHALGTKTEPVYQLQVGHGRQAVAQAIEW